MQPRALCSSNEAGVIPAGPLPFERRQAFEVKTNADKAAHCIKRGGIYMTSAKEYRALDEFRKCLAYISEKLKGGITVTQAVDICLAKKDPHSIASVLTLKAQGAVHGPYISGRGFIMPLENQMEMFKIRFDSLPDLIDAIETKIALIVACVFDLDLGGLHKNIDSKNMDRTFGMLGINSRVDRDKIFQRAIQIVEERVPDDELDKIVELNKPKDTEEAVVEQAQVSDEVDTDAASQKKSITGSPETRKLIEIIEKLLPGGFFKFLSTLDLAINDIRHEEMVELLAITYCQQPIPDFIREIKEKNRNVASFDRGGRKSHIRGIKQSGRGISRRTIENAFRAHQIQTTRNKVGRVITQAFNSSAVTAEFIDPCPLAIEVSNSEFAEDYSELLEIAREIASSYLRDDTVANLCEVPGRYSYQTRFALESRIGLEEGKGNELLLALGLTQLDFINAWCYWRCQTRNPVPTMTELLAAINDEYSKVPSQKLTRASLLERLVKLEKLCNDSSDLDNFVRPASVFITDLTHGEINKTDKLVLEAYVETLKQSFKNYYDFIERLLNHQTLKKYGMERTELSLRLRKMSLTAHDLYLLKAYGKLKAKPKGEVTSQDLIIQAKLACQEFDPKYFEDQDSLMSRVQYLVKNYPALGVLEKGLN